MNRSESIKELACALAKAQSAMRGAVKDSENPHFRSKYADLASVWEACRAALGENGLSIVQAPRTVEGGVEVETMLLHQSGEWISESLAIPVSKQDAQGFGSALTYCRRYGLSSIVGIAPEDDDGNAASAAKPEHFSPERKRVNKPIAARDGAREALGADETAQVDKLANGVLDAFLAGDEKLAFTKYLDARTLLRSAGADVQAAFWDRFDSKQRSTLSKNLEAERTRRTAEMLGSQA